MPIDVINMTLMATLHDMPLEDAQELHVVVVMFIVVAIAIIIVEEGSVTGTAARVGVLSVVPPPPLPRQGGS